jgi:hypothetical protein
MIDTTNETRCKNPSCGKPVHQISGHRRREYCNDTCKQTAYRIRKEQVHHGVMIVDDRQNIRRIEQYAMDCSIAEGKAKERIAQLEQELTQYRQIAALMDRAKMEARFMELGEQVQYQTLTTLNILGGYGYWFDFMKRAKDEGLLKAIAAVEYYLEGLIALHGDPRERRIAELERENKDLQARLDYEERYLTDTRKRDFKIWLRSHPQPSDTTFFKRFLDDRDMPSAASQAMYEAKLYHSKNYDAVDILLFKHAWRRMLFNQS